MRTAVTDIKSILETMEVFLTNFLVVLLMLFELRDGSMQVQVFYVQQTKDHPVGNYLQQKKVIANIVFTQRLFCVYKLFKDINMLEFQTNIKRLSSLYYPLTVT